MKNISKLITAAVLATLSWSTSAETSVKQTVRFDAADNQLPEGLAHFENAIYIGMATSQQVVKVKDGQSTLYAQFPKLPASAGFLTGLMIDSSGVLYAGLSSFSAKVKTGIYRVAKQGGTPELFAHHLDMAFPNDFVTLADGAFLVSDSIKGRIWHVTKNGKVSEWLSHELLRGDPEVCAPDEIGFAIGANGMDIGPDGTLYVAVTDRAMILRIEIKDNKAGELRPLNATNCALLEGADGIVAMEKGVVVAANRTDQLSLVSYDGKITSLHSGAPLDFPASIVKRGGDLLITNFSLIRAAKDTAKPGLISLSFEK